MRETNRRYNAALFSDGNIGKSLTWLAVAGLLCVLAAQCGGKL